MASSNSDFYDVIIAGAGPVGLFLACELRLAGCSVMVIEKAPNPHSQFKMLPFGLRGLTTPTTDSFDRRNLLDPLTGHAAGRQTPAAAHWMQPQRRPGGHFAGIQFFYDQVEGKDWPFRLAGPVNSVAADMASIEAVLATRAIASGVCIRRSCGFESFQPSEDGVAVRAGGETVTGRWLVGCDGGRSAVRKAAGIGFIGTDPEFTGYSAQVVLADTSQLRPGRHATTTGVYTYTAPGMIAMVDFDRGAFHRTVPITRAHVEAVLRKVSGTNVEVAALELAATWTDRAYQATDYRKGRVLLAGDAAHTHSPLGGQGLNLGLGDAMNLGWKLAATIRGDAPLGLLDSYAQERQPVGASILDWSRAQVVLMRPDPAARALRKIVRDLIGTRDGATYFAERVWGVGLRYDLAGAHPLAGRSAPDFQLMDGTTLNEHLRAGRGLLLDFDGCASLRRLANHWGERVVYVANSAKARLGVSALLVRPDGFVAWATDVAGEEHAAEQALSKWFGRHRCFREMEDRPLSTPSESV